ncbi:MAG: polyphosphate kinase 1 [Flavobacteriales bacterium]|jgi:polyphosphate kinase|nr:polyphosphate kinase 1 [Flavobacteriales bacterium]
MLINRELSWLSFNERVLQESEDQNNPLIERMRFLGIFSNNLDEFYRVRVASAKRIVEVTKNEKEKEENILLLKKITKKTIELQKRFDKVFFTILKELRKKNIYLDNDNTISGEYLDYIESYFQENLKHDIFPILLKNLKNIPSLNDEKIYLLVDLAHEDKEKSAHAIVEIPSDRSRFVILPKQKKEEKTEIVLLDDVIRLNLHKVFETLPYEVKSSYTFKITRDAELDFDNEYSEGMLAKIKKSLQQRKSGDPVRFVHDKKMPKDILEKLTKALDIDETDSVIPGGKYHNFKDFIGFPSLGRKDLNFEPFPPIKHPKIKDDKSIFPQLKKEDILLHYPYHSFDHFIDMLQEASIDPKVKKIQIFIYRLASNSKVAKALVNAARNGKQVTAVIELKARFDESNNIEWTKYLQDRGVRVLHGFEGLKIHTKLCVITRKESNEQTYYAAIGTGNFNEKTAKIYSDVLLFTADKRVTKEVVSLFDIVEGRFNASYHRHIVLSPRNTRNKMVRLINFEIRQAKMGSKAKIRIKLNSLVDEKLITKLYEASQAGVKIEIIVRGICCLVPGVKKLSENIKVISILDRFLEHTRIYYFYHGGNEKYYISSADFMVRNLDRRIELTCPIYDEKLQQELKDFFKIQWKDSVKARIIDKDQNNLYAKSTEKEPLRAQYELYNYFKLKANGK